MNEAAVPLIAFAAALMLSAFVRGAFLARWRHGAVDHYYWILAARAYRTQRGLPVRIENKYLLEDERQAYPPGFGAFLALFPDALLRSPRSAWLMVAIDAATLAVLLGVAVVLALPAWSLAAVTAVHGLAPVLAAYNTQLTSRGLGNLALVIALLAQAGAVSVSGAPALVLWLVAIAATAGVILTHKMTTQLMLALWPAWALTLGSLWALLVPPFGLAAATAITGPSFQRLQWRAHGEIVAFWHRNWRFLGAHPFRQSPIYGDPERPAPTAFHQPGLAGAARHALLAFGYLPAAWILPVTLAVAPAPPGWVIAWLGTALVLCLATLLVPPLKCLGGGHLYLFGAVPPAALWWGTLLAAPSSAIVILFAAAMLLTAASLAAGWRRRGRGGAPDDLAPMIGRLAGLPPRRIAVFPVTAAERVAFETPHAVFWGGHGLGFSVLEPYFPVFRQPIGEAMRRHRIDLVLLDTAWWPEGEAVLARELGGATAERFGRWIIHPVTVQPAASSAPARMPA